MIPKKNRITSFFFRFLTQGRVYHSPIFSLKVVPNKEDEEFHVAVVVSKKVAQKAVERNLLKRRFLSVVQNNKNLCKKGFFYVFYVKKEIQTSEFSSIEKEVSRVLHFVYEKNN